MLLQFVFGVLPICGTIIRMATTAVALSFIHVQQQSGQCIEDDDIRRFCAITPYQYSEALQRATKANESAVEWLKMMLGKVLVGIAMLQNIDNGWRNVVLQHVLIEPSCRKKGLGTHVVQYVTERAARVTLATRTADTMAFFSARGFQMVVDDTMLLEVIENTFGLTTPPEYEKNTGGLMSSDTLSILEAFELSIKFGLLAPD